MTQFPLSSLCEKAACNMKYKLHCTKMVVKTDVENVWESITPTHKCCSFLALWCFERDHDGSYRRAFKHTADSVLYFIFVAFIVVMWIPNRTTEWESVKDSLLVHYLLEMYLTVLPATGLYSFVIVQLIAQTKINALMSLQEVDECLKAMGYQRALMEINRYMWKFSMFASIGASVTVLSGLIISLFTMEFYDLTWWWQELAFAISYLLHMFVISQFIVWCQVLEKRFQLLRTALKGMIAQSHFTVEYPDNEVQFIVVIKKVAVVHYTLTHIARKIIYAYSLSLFLQVVIYFILLLCEGYILVYILTLGDQLYFSALMDACYYVIAAAIELVVIVHTASSLCSQVKKQHSGYPEELEHRPGPAAIYTLAVVGKRNRVVMRMRV